MDYFIKILNLDPYLGMIIFKTKLTHGKPLCSPISNISTNCITCLVLHVNRREKENSCRAGNDHKLKKGEIVASIIEPMCLCLIYEIMRELELLVLYVYIWKTKLFCLLCHVVNCTSSNLIPLLCGCEIAKQKLSLDSIALQHFSFFIHLLWVTGKMNSRTEGWNSFFSFSEMRTQDSS